MILQPHYKHNNGLPTTEMGDICNAINKADNQYTFDEGNTSTLRKTLKRTASAVHDF